MYISQLIPVKSLKAKLKVKRSFKQRLRLKSTLLLALIVLSLLGGLVWTLMDFFTTTSDVFDFKQMNWTHFKSVIIADLVSLVIVMTWILLHTKFSPIEKYRIMKLLLNFTEEADLLQQHSSDINLTKSVLWMYRIINGKYEIELRTGGHLTSSQEEDLPRRLLGYLKKETADEWYLEDSRLMDGIIKITLSHTPDERITIDLLETLKQSETLDIQLTKRLSWTSSQPMGMVVGPTGTGKTTLLKVLILSFLKNNRKNKVYTIDGKGAYLSTAMKNIGDVATTPQKAIKMMEKLEQIMNERYQELNAFEHDESDKTHVEKFHKGNILLVIDEILAMVTTIQAEDKQRKTADKLYPRFYKVLLNLIVKGRQASIICLISGQMIPVSILSSEARDSLSLRIALGRISQSQAIEIFNMSKKDLPRVDTSNYGGVIWLDGMNLEKPLEFMTPYYDDSRLPFKRTLKKLRDDRK